MAPLDDDCFAPQDRLLTVEAALALIRDRVVPVVGRRSVAVRRALGRILAEDVVSPIDVPAHDNSAVDGYAVFAGDLAGGGETRLPVTGRIAAGHPLGRPARRGEALRVFTGAVMPEGPDTVVMEEECRIENGMVVVRPGVRAGANRRRAGEDIRAGNTVLRRGRRLRAQDLGVAASVGRRRLCVHRRLRAAVFSTGDEIREPAAGPMAPGCVFDSNRYAVIGLLDGLGCEVTDLGILPDRYQAIRAALAAAAAGHELLVTSGGVSRGEEDHVRQAVESLGRLHFWRLAVKPGRPLALGQVGGAAFVGLPGNPVAAMATFMRIGRPLVILLAGGTEIAPAVFRVRAGFALPGKKPGRREWLRVRLAPGDDGPVAVTFAPEGSGILTSMVGADGLVELGEDQGPVAAGSLVDFLPFSELSR